MRCSTIGKCPFMTALWSAVSFSSVRSNMWSPITGARYWATPTWPRSADRWKALNPPYGCTNNIMVCINKYINRDKVLLVSSCYIEQHMLQSVQASVVVHGRHRPSSIMAYWELLIPTSNATSNLTPFCNTPTLHSMAYCLFSVLAFPWFTIQYANVLWWNKTEKVTLFNSSHSYIHTQHYH